MFIVITLILDLAFIFDDVSLSSIAVIPIDTTQNVSDQKLTKWIFGDMTVGVRVSEAMNDNEEGQDGRKDRNGSC